VAVGEVVRVGAGVGGMVVVEKEEGGVGAGMEVEQVGMVRAVVQGVRVGAAAGGMVAVVKVVEVVRVGAMEVGVVGVTGVVKVGVMEVGEEVRVEGVVVKEVVVVLEGRVVGPGMEVVELLQWHRQVV
jgi:hypothetical protein